MSNKTFFDLRNVSCSSCKQRVSPCVDELEQSMTNHFSPHLHAHYSDSFKSCFCETSEQRRVFSKCITDYKVNVPSSSSSSCKVFHNFPSAYQLPTLCESNPIPKEFFLDYYNQYYQKNSINTIQTHSEFQFWPLIFLLLSLTTFIMIALFIRKKCVEGDALEDFNTNIPLEDRNLYHYHQEFGDEQLPKYEGREIITLPDKSYKIGNEVESNEIKT
ncbi:hypothetical protein HDU92_007527 [Lobulomyces angularis]|nr:hypothetical protein HDU92_007527 [Lobulomyces angularis]